MSPMVNTTWPTRFFILIHEYTDRSAFRVVGLTTLAQVANAWEAAAEVSGTGEHKVYRLTLEELKPEGYRAGEPFAD